MDADWPLSPALLHLNHGSFGAVPRFALAAQAALRDEMESAPVRWFAGLPDRLAVWVGNLHKFGCAPRSTGVLITRRTDLWPLIDSWGAPLPYPQRFDVQGTLDVTAQPAAPATLTGIEERWGWAAIRARASATAATGAEVIAGAFTALTGEDHTVRVGMPAGPMRLIRLPGTLGTGPGAPDTLRARVLAELDAECAFGQFGGVGYLRVSAHVYNTAADYEEFAARCVPVIAGWA